MSIAAEGNVERLHALLKKFGKHLDPDTFAILYGRLAEEAGPEPVRDVTAPDPDRTPAPHPEDPASRPLETAVRQRLDNDPHRWRIMVRRPMEAGPLEYAQLVDLVQAVGDGAGEAAEGET